MPLISCKNCTLAYDSNILIKDLSFSVNAGNYLCIVGKNGSGKSTLMHAILGLKSLNGGEIEYGDGLTKTSIGFLPQQTNVRFDFPASVFEVVLSGCRSSHLHHTAHDKKNAEDKLELLGISHLKKHPFAYLSGGQRQRVLLARALFATKKLLLLDEPTSGLDPMATVELYDLIEKINKSGITVITVSHDLASAMKYASHILHLGDDFIFFGTTEEYEKSDVGHYYLGSCD